MKILKICLAAVLSVLVITIFYGGGLIMTALLLKDYGILNVYTLSIDGLILAALFYWIFLNPQECRKVAY